MYIRSILILALLSLTFYTHSADHVKVLKPLLAMDKRAKHKDEVIFRSLELTVPEFGLFTLEAVNVDMTPGRAFTSMKTGELINTFIAAASEQWEQNTIPIKVPIRQGLMSYRLLLVHKKNLKKFENISTLKELATLTAGLQKNWVITDIFARARMNMTTSHTFEGLFSMLNKGRFDYTPRAIYEAYDELNNRNAILPDIVVEPTLALHVPMVTYVYVSKNAPNIAKRIEAGLNKMVDNGELKAILDKYYAQDIKRANLPARHIIEIENPNFTEKNKNIIEDNNLWREY